MIDTAEIEVAAPLREVEKLLWRWAEWMQYGGAIARGFPRQTIFGGSGNSNSDDFERDIDVKNGRDIDTIINKDLPEKERAAINFRYLGERYMYDSTGYDYVDTLKNAHILVEEKAIKKGIIIKEH